MAKRVARGLVVFPVRKRTLFLAFIIGIAMIYSFFFLLHIFPDTRSPLASTPSLSSLFSSPKKPELAAPSELQRVAPELSAVVIRELPHDPSSFTQGLEFHAGQLYESVGLYGKSWVGQVQVDTGRALRKYVNDDKHFGEGLTVLNGVLYQLTWRRRVILILDPVSLELQNKAVLPQPIKQGWGVTHCRMPGDGDADEEVLVISDGTAKLHFVDPGTLRVRGSVTVHEWQPDGQVRAVSRLNELENVGGLIYANIWYDDRIAVIRPSTGEVLFYINCAELYPRAEHAWRRNSDAVLNGIALSPSQGSLYVTGKLWPYMVEIELPDLEAIH